MEPWRVRLATTLQVVNIVLVLFERYLPVVPRTEKVGTAFDPFGPPALAWAYMGKASYGLAGLQTVPVPIESTIVVTFSLNSVR